MTFREVRVYEIKEILRLWLRGESVRSIERMTATDRKTVRRYLDAALGAGVERTGGEEQLNDEVLGVICEKVRPHRPRGRGEAWETLVAHHDDLVGWLVGQRLTVVKAGELLARRGVVVPERTLHRYALEVLEVGRTARRTTVRVADGEPGMELQVDFGKMGMITDQASGKRRACWALIFTACYSRHCFVSLGVSQDLETVIAGFEAAWEFFGGVFKVVIPDNMGTVVTTADPIDPRLNQAFVEYAQARGFVIDAARVRTPTDKPRVERTVPFVRNSFFAGETFIDLADAQRRAIEWCSDRAGRRIHGTHACRPVELFMTEEAPRLLPGPTSRYDLPIYATVKVHRDHHIEVGRALYSIPGNLIGAQLQVRVDRQLMRAYHRGVVVKVHPRQAVGGRITDPADLPSERTAYAMRDLDHLRRLAAAEGVAIGAYADAVLDTPLPWTKMRQVYALVGLVKRWGPERVEAAYTRALESEAISVALIGRMIERATENEPAVTATVVKTANAATTTTPTLRFARDVDHFAVNRADGGRHAPARAEQAAEQAELADVTPDGSVA